MFFYSLVYDPAQKTLIADKGEIRIGDKYQATVAPTIPDEEREAYRKEALEIPVYLPYHSLTERQIDQYMIVARWACFPFANFPCSTTMCSAVGTFARALDMSSSAKQPNLHLTAAAASRDITPFQVQHLVSCVEEARVSVGWRQALAMLHHAQYDVARAVEFLVPAAHKQCYPLDADRATQLHTATLGGPLLCRDQLEEWSAAEANLFDEALEKYGKDFNDIRQDFVSRRRVLCCFSPAPHLPAALEIAARHRRVLLHVEDDRPLRAAEARQGGRGRVAPQAGLHPRLHQAQPERAQRLLGRHRVAGQVLRELCRSARVHLAPNVFYPPLCFQARRRTSGTPGVRRAPFCASVATAGPTGRSLAVWSALTH